MNKKKLNQSKKKLKNEKKRPDKLVAGCSHKLKKKSAARVRAEDALCESEIHFRTLADTGQALIWTSGVDKKCDYFNKPWLKFTGRTLKQELGDGWAEGVHPDDLHRCFKIYTEAFDRRKKFSMEYRIRHSSGEYRWIQDDGTPRYNSKGEFIGYIGHCLDVSEMKNSAELLKKSEEQVRLLLNSTAEAIYGIDLNGDCTFANPSCARTLGYAGPEMLLGRNMHKLIHHSRKDGSLMPVEECSIYMAFREGRGVHRDDEVLWKADGSSFPVEYWSYPQYLNGKVYGAVVAFIDITKRKQMEKMVTDEKQRLSYILEGTNVGTWEWNVQTGETVFNERWAEIIGFTLAELAPVSIETWKKYMHPGDMKISDELLEKHFNKELNYYEFEARMRHKNGSWVWVLDRGKVVTWTADGKPLLMSGTHQDITERKLAEEKIRHLMSHDVLTDLPGLRLATDRLSLALSLARRHKKMAAVMFIDLDGFKGVNDTFGHDAGDYVLKQVAKRLLSCVRESDTVARIGGDEFLIIAGELQSTAGAALIAEKAISMVSQPLTVEGKQVAVGASIGIAIYPEHGENMAQLVKKADEAMYRVKNAGKNGFGFSPSPEK